MRSRYWIFLACLQIATAAACGDDDNGDGPGDGGVASGGGSTTVDTGLTASAKLSSLDDDDAQKACMSTAHTFNTVLPDAKWEEVGCKLLAIVYVYDKHGGMSDESHIAECESIVKKCVNGDPIDGKKITIETQVTDESRCKSVSAAKAFGDCEATVADYESCESKRASELKKRFSGISCDGVKDVPQFQMDLGAAFDIGSWTECEAVRSKCPNLDLTTDTEPEPEIDAGDAGDEGDEG